MKMKLIPLVCLAANLFCPVIVNAQTFFDETLDGAPYHNDLMLNDDTYPVVGYDVLEHGAWTIHNGQVSSSTERWLSEGRSLKVAGANAQFLAILGETGSAATPTFEALEINFAFNLTSTSSFFEFVVRDQAGDNLVIVGISSRIDGYFGSGHQDTGTIVADTWYNVKILLSANPGTGTDTYSISLYDALGTTQIGSTLNGSFLPSNGTGYYYMTGILAPGNPATDSIYLDNLSAKAIPEGSEVIYTLLGGALCFGVFRGRRVMKGAI